MSFVSRRAVAAFGTLGALALASLLLAACGGRASRVGDFSPQGEAVGCVYGAELPLQPAPGERCRDALLHTHCGVVSLVVEGERWRAEPPLYNTDRTGPPPGWDDPFQLGQFKRLSQGRGVFVASNGKLASLVPAGSWQPPACD